MIGLVDPGLGHYTVCVCADGGFDVVFACCEFSGEGGGGGDILCADEESVMVCVRVFGNSV